MKKYFGTDGIRGVANSFLTPQLCFQTGNALSRFQRGLNVCIGRDTRGSGTMVLNAICAGITSGGGNVCNLGIMPTAGVAYLTVKNRFDLGVVISASHNPKEHNGIKIFSSDGYKLTDETELIIESLMDKTVLADSVRIGEVINCDNQAQIYTEMLLDSCKTNLHGLKVVLDCSNGAASCVAPAVFQALGAETIVVGNDMCGGNINHNCGCLHPQLVTQTIKLHNADLGFAYDGDSDRLIAVSGSGKLIDGDMLVYILAKHYKTQGRLKNGFAVGTQYTNMGIEKALEKDGIALLRSDVGDKYVIEMMKTSGAAVGGEQSGHIILGDKSTTGDGILCSVCIAGLVKSGDLTLEQMLEDVKLYPQKLINVNVTDKERTMNDPRLKAAIEREKILAKESGRLLVRCSGTEPKIRVMAEGLTKEKADSSAERIAALIAEIECFD